VGRQPILDREGRTYGYELLFRAMSTSESASRRDEEATSRVIVDTFADFGLDRLVPAGRAFINVTRPFLTGMIQLPFPGGRTVLEVMPGTQIDDQILAGVRALREQGFAFALDGMTPGDPRSALRVAGLVDVIKIDVDALDAAQLAEIARREHGGGVLLAATHVETPQQWAEALRAGFDLFQGYWVGRPTVHSTRAASPSHAGSLALLEALSHSDVQVADVVALVECDVALTYRLLRLVNSAAAGLHRPVASVSDAVVLLGLERIRAWVVLMVLAGGHDEDSQLLGRALVRARHCELLARDWAGVSPPTAFLTGLLSSLDELLDAPVGTVVADLPLEPAISTALIHRQGPLGAILRAVLAYEQADLTGLPTLPGGVDLEELRRTYLDATAWSDDIRRIALNPT
jgi:EAL and modified HD-GYP domain-containing signal transduction protein